MAFPSVMDIRHPASDYCMDRDLECELAISPEFQRLIETALAAGWSDDEVANALLSLTQDHVHTMRSRAIIDTPPNLPRRTSH
jgi:hypothetical protein